jgi:prenyltransferase beta subunit
MEKKMLTKHKPGIRNTAVAWLATLTLLLTSAGAVLAADTSNIQAASKAVTWMHSQQQPDGSFAGFGAGSTVDALLAIVAVGQDPASFSQGGNTPVSFLQSKAKDIAKTAGGAGKLLIASRALGMDGRSFGGVDLVSAIQATYGISATGQYGPDAIGHAFAILGLEAAGVQPDSKAIERLSGLQTPEGGWAFAGAGKPDTNTTPVAVQALLGAGVKADSAPMQKALAYLLSQRNGDGGYPYQQGGDFGSDSDTNSTAYVVQALVALNASVKADSGEKFLLGLQNASGAFAYQKSQPDDNAGATYQVVPALLGATFLNTKPAQAPVIAPAPTPGMPTTGSAADLPLVAFGTLLALVSVALGMSARHKAGART